MKALICVLACLAGEPTVEKSEEMTEREAVDFFRLKEARFFGRGEGNACYFASLSTKLLKDQDLEKLRHLPQLRILTIRHSPQLRRPNIAAMSSRDGGAGFTESALQHLKNLKNLKSLNIHGRLFSDKALSYLKDVPQIEELDLGFCNVSDKGLAELKHLKKLKTLKLAGLQITDAGLAHIGKVPSLETLNLSILRRVTSKGFETHVPLIKNLKKLHIHRLPITDDAIASLRVLPRLETVRFSNTRITGPGLAMLPQVKRMALSGPLISNSTLGHLQGLPELTHLALHETGVTEMAIKEFQATHPKCRVHSMNH